MLNIAQPPPEGPFWDGVAASGDHYDIIGGEICGTFVVVGLMSVRLYRPWRRWIDRRRGGVVSVEDREVDDVSDGEEGQGQITNMGNDS